MKLIYVIGLPGSGKSSTVRRALLSKGYANGTEHEQPVPHIEWSNGTATVTELGRRRESFSGTDALALNIQPKATDWLRTTRAQTVIAEGDRLANPSFFANAIDIAESFTVAWIDVPAELARSRAKRRAENLGRPEQNETWWKGRATKVSNLVEAHPDRLHRIDGTLNPRLVAEALAQLL